MPGARHARVLLLAVLAAHAIVPLPVAAQSAAARRADVARVVARLEPEVRRALVEGQIPSLTLALVDRGGVLHTQAFGTANLWAGTPATVETVYLIGSTFKAQSTVALLQHLEAGRFRLDDPVRDHLGGALVIRGEDPARPVTFRHLLTHTSGMPVAFGPHAVWGGTRPPLLQQYLADSLRVATPPLERVVYSNMAYSLVGWLVERFSGKPYRDYIREHVWAPIGMTGTAFSPTAAMDERLSVPYVVGASGRLEPTDRLDATVWPAGIVYGTIADQAKWVTFNLNDGAVPGGARLLSAATLDSMFVLQFPQHAGTPHGGGWGYDNPGYGLTWWTTSRGGETYFAHSGSVPGYTSFVMGSRTLGVGVALLTNGNQAHPHLVRLANLAVDLLAAEIAAPRD
jgi:CubicO group peptidase (beta-lactamase class C family)